MDNSEALTTFGTQDTGRLATLCQGVIDCRNIERPHSALLIIQTCFVHMFACLIVVTSKFIYFMALYKI
jgi:hypothetical protein